VATRAMERPPARRADGITKERFLAAVVCPARGWWDAHVPTAPTSRAVRFRMDEGRFVHRVARTLYPDGVRISTLNLDVAVRLTRDLSSDPETRTLFEAAFRADGCVARSDILYRRVEGSTPEPERPHATFEELRAEAERGVERSTPPTDAELLAIAGTGDEDEEEEESGAAWDIIEVKSGTKPEGYYTDLAYTVMVARRAGLHVGRALLLTINRDYTRGMPRTDLFVETDCTQEVAPIVEAFERRRDDVRESLRAPEAPEGWWSWSCRECPHFNTRCWGRGVRHPVFELPRLREPSWRQIIQGGAHGIRGITDEAIDRCGALADRWWRVRECVRTREPWVGEGLSGALDAIEWPAHYLDFETVMTPIPLYPDVHPVDQIPTQYSVHTLEDPSALDAVAGVGLNRSNHVDRVRHREFIAQDPSRDCRRELAEHLLHDLGDRGSVLMYTAFERHRLLDLASLYPDLAEAIQAVVARLVDLADIIRAHYYHPEFHGSYSIKTVLPALAPDLTYDGRAIGNGLEAAAAFAEMARGRMDLQTWDRTRGELLEYCKLDTWAMVRLHAFLAERA
jgi:hypothetical protein